MTSSKYFYLEHISLVIIFMLVNATTANGGAINRGKLLIFIATTSILLILAFIQDEEQLGYSKRV